jgi:hypothetical protein
VEAGYDFLIVNNVAFSGSSTPHGKAGMTSPEQDRDEWWTSMSRERSMGKTTPDQQLNKYRESSQPNETHHDINGDLYGNRPNERSSTSQVPEPNSIIQWYADYSVRMTGFKICHRPLGPCD